MTRQPQGVSGFSGFRLPFLKRVRDRVLPQMADFRNLDSESLPPAVRPPAGDHAARLNSSQQSMMVPSARSPERPGRDRVWRVAPDRQRERPPLLPPLSRCEASSPLCEHLPRRSEGVIRTSPEPHELPREMATELGSLPLTAQWRSESRRGHAKSPEVSCGRK